MNPSNKKPIIKYWIIFFILLISITACSTTRKSSLYNTDKEDVPVKPSHPITLYADEIENIILLWGNQEDKNKEITGSDFYLFSELLSSAVYNAYWNESGIMFKMVAPDYTVSVSYKNKSPEENDLAMIWKEANRLKFRNIWYNLPEEQGKKLYRLLDKY
ncbi:MAG: hypothetical protein LUG18_13180 [Candidatus Azobacteroides sp.]|nr:hypothetical protein [Candidatus Azobacteroides sp.]